MTLSCFLSLINLRTYNCVPYNFENTGFVHCVRILRRRFTPDARWVSKYLEFSWMTRCVHEVRFFPYILSPFDFELVTVIRRTCCCNPVFNLSSTLRWSDGGYAHTYIDGRNWRNNSDTKWSWAWGARYPVHHTLNPLNRSHRILELEERQINRRHPTIGRYGEKSRKELNQTEVKRKKLKTRKTTTYQNYTAWGLKKLLSPPNWWHGKRWSQNG